MNYDETHTEDDCDKCQERFGKKNLTDVPFLYLDKNDTAHVDKSPLLKLNYAKVLEEQGVDRPTAIMFASKKVDSGYRQYKVCKGCLDIEIKRCKK